MKIIPYDARYRDDMIFMVLQAKDALGRVPRLNEDLLDVPGNYLDRGDGFWLALDEGDRVIGCVGFSRIPGTEEAFLHRLYVKAAEKRKGIGSALLETAEEEMRRQGIRLSRVHLGEPREQWFESYAFYAKHGYREYAERYWMKDLSQAPPLREFRDSLSNAAQNLIAQLLSRLSNFRLDNLAEKSYYLENVISIRRRTYESARNSKGRTAWTDQVPHEL